PETAATAPSGRGSRSCGAPSTIAATSSTAAESAAKSADERNDACRWPTVPLAATSAPKNSAMPTTVAAQLQSVSDQSCSSRSRDVRTSTGSAGASSAYSKNFSSVTVCVESG